MNKTKLVFLPDSHIGSLNESKLINKLIIDINLLNNNIILSDVVTPIFNVEMNNKND